MIKLRQTVTDIGKASVGCLLFALSLNLLLLPNELNAGGVTGLSMSIVHTLGIGSVGLFTTLINLPLFIFSTRILGKRFLLGSLFGMILSSVLIDTLSALPAIQAEPLLAALYGGSLCGLGLGLVFSTGMTTGGTDIVVRLLKRRWREIPIGKIMIAFDFLVAVVTGLAFRDATKTLYSGIAIIVTGLVMDAVIYRFDYSRTVLIISSYHDQIAERIGKELYRGATFLEGQGSFTGNATKVVLTAVKRQQLAQLKRLVLQIDPNAFVIVHEAHQVLGDGFSRYVI